MARGDEKAEWTFARLRYPTRGSSYDGFGGFGGFRGGGWSEDYPKADRQFVEGLRRLTRLNARPYQEVLEPDSEDLFNWPWLYAVNVGTWDFTDEQGARMRRVFTCFAADFLIRSTVFMAWPNGRVF